MIRFTRGHVRRFMNRFNERIINIFKEQNTDTIRTWLTQR